jgi:hypothetical protein
MGEQRRLVCGARPEAQQAGAAARGGSSSSTPTAAATTDMRAEGVPLSHERLNAHIVSTSARNARFSGSGSSCSCPPLSAGRVMASSEGTTSMAAVVRVSPARTRGERAATPAMKESRTLRCSLVSSLASRPALGVMIVGFEPAAAGGRQTWWKAMTAVGTKRAWQRLAKHSHSVRSAVCFMVMSCVVQEVVAVKQLAWQPSSSWANR